MVGQINKIIRVAKKLPMGNVFGSLNVKLHTPDGKEPKNNSELCLTSLHSSGDTSVYLGGCAMDGTYEVDTNNGTIGYFKGCPSNIHIKSSIGTQNYEVIGSCAHIFPFPWSNKTLRRVFLWLIILLFGVLTFWGVMRVYNHDDSTNTVIGDRSA